MKTITLVVEGVADSQADNNKEIEIAIKGKTDAAESAGRAVVEALEEAGISVTAARLVTLPRPGSHEAGRTIDLTVEPEGPEPVLPAPASTEPAPAPAPANP